MPGVPGAEIFTSLKRLQKHGRHLDAWELIRDLDPPEQWLEAEHRMSGARLLQRLGAEERSRRLILREWRRKGPRLWAREEMVWLVLRKRGALVTWQWLRKNAPAEGEDQEAWVDHHGYRGYVLTKLRDFQRAEAALKEGFKLDPSSRWLRLLQADLLEAQDRREDALALVEAILAADPNYVSAISSRAEILSDLRRDDEAAGALQKGLAEVQSGQLAAQLANLLIELNRFDEAEAALDLYERVTPLREGRARDWVHGRRCDLASYRGDQAAALRWAGEIQEDGFYKRVAAKLMAAEGALRRKVLPVAFVRQHHSTCAPATVTSLAHFWGHDVVHLDLADEICYDGTPDYRERDWAEKNGWATREFRVTVEAAKQLIDAGMPFVLNTVYPGGAHAQAVMGYDEFRTVLFIRDPGNRTTTEFLAEEALKEQAPFGPRGFVMTPPTEAARLAALPLPDSEVYDLTHAISAGLYGHDRAEAAGALEALRRDWPNHLLRWHGELSMARYDGNYSHALRCLEELLKLHPDVVNWQTEQVHMIREVRGREAVLAFLRETCAKKDSHPILWRMLARELQSDDRNSAEVARWLRRVHRHRVDAQAAVAQANLHWAERRWPEATEWYRVASCLDARNEGLAMSYFSAAKWTRQTEAALSLLRRRYEDEGHLSGAPACTLARALEQLDRATECLEVLEDSLKRRPDDADHAMHVAGEFASWGRAEQARAILEQTPKNARAAAWHRVQARLAQKEGNNARQLEHWRAVVADQPLDSGAHRSIAALLELQEGTPAAVAHLRAACGRFPYHWQLHMALLDWLRVESPEAWQQGVRELLRIDPDDAWAHRELADALRAADQYEAAHAELDLAAQLEPRNASLHAVRAAVLQDEGKINEARAACRRALELDVDNGTSLRSLIQLCRTQEERLAELRFVQAELKRQTTSGDGVLEFAQVARRYLDVKELLEFLREGHEARPDLWQTGVMLVEQFRHAGLMEEAVAKARQLTEQFPLMPRVWMELGLSLEAGGRRDEAIHAAGKVRELNPGWGWGMMTLSELLRKKGDYGGARAVLEQALRLSPQNSRLHGYLADVLWHDKEKTAALEHLKEAVDIDPGYGWAWDRLTQWGEEAGQPDANRRALEKLMRERPAEARTWMMHANTLTQSSQFEERLAALDKAMECAPEAWGPVDEKARLLGLAGRYEAALQLCRNHLSGAAGMRLREAWLLYRKGNYDEAVKVMTGALADDPGQTWGWQLLVEWHQERQKLDLAEEALQQLSRLEPAEPTHLGYLAEIQLAREKRKEARETLKRSLEVAPDYRFGFQKLFWMDVEDRDYRAAEQTVEQTRAHLTAIEYHARRFIPHCRQRQWPQAWERLEQMLADPEDGERAFALVQDELKLMPAKMAREMEKLVRHALPLPSVNINAAQLYVKCCDVLDKLPKTKILAALPEGSVAGKRALDAYIDQLARYWSAKRKQSGGLAAHRAGWRLRRLMKQRRKWLRSDPLLYGGISYALHTMERFGAVIEWLHDWRERPDLEPYMMNNLILSLQVKGRREEAAAVIARGLTLSDHNDSKMRFHIWAAIDHGLREEEGAARAHLDAVNVGGLSDFSKILNDFALLLMRYQPSADSFPAFDEEAKGIVRKFLRSHRNNPVMKDAALRLCMLAGRKLRSLQPPLWGIIQRWKPAFVLLGAALLFAWVWFERHGG